MPMLLDDNDGELCPPTCRPVCTLSVGESSRCRLETQPSTYQPEVLFGPPTDNLSDLVHKMDIDTVPTHTTSPSSRAAGATSASDVDDPDGLQGDGEDAVGELEGDNGGSSFSQWPLQVHPGPYPPGRNLPRYPVGTGKLPTRDKHKPAVSTRSSTRLASKPSSVPVARRAQQKLMRELDFINV